MTSPTIKVSAQMRDRLNEEARSRGVPVNSVLEMLLAEHERRVRFEKMREAFANTATAEAESYREETEANHQLNAPWPTR